MKRKLSNSTEFSSSNSPQFHTNSRDEQNIEDTTSTLANSTPEDKEINGKYTKFRKNQYSQHGVSIIENVSAIYESFKDYSLEKGKSSFYLRENIPSILNDLVEHLIYDIDDDSAMKLAHLHNLAIHNTEDIFLKVAFGKRYDLAKSIV